MTEITGIKNSGSYWTFPKIRDLSMMLRYSCAPNRPPSSYRLSHFWFIIVLSVG